MKIYQYTSCSSSLFLNNSLSLTNSDRGSLKLDLARSEISIHLCLYKQRYHTIILNALQSSDLFMPTTKLLQRKHAQ